LSLGKKVLREVSKYPHRAEALIVIPELKSAGGKDYGAGRYETSRKPKPTRIGL
jgi:hypothetical protein